NQAASAVEPLGHSLVDALEDAIVAAQPLIEFVGDLAEGFANLDDNTKRLIVNILAISAAIGPLLYLIGKVVAAIGAVTAGVRTLTLALVALAKNPVVLAFTALATVIGL